MKKTTPYVSSLSPCVLKITALLISGGIASPALLAVDIDNWQIQNGSTYSGLTTNSPVFGDGGTDSADSHFLYAALDTTYALDNVGDSITFSGEFAMTGGNFNPSSGSNQFRYGLYDSNGSGGTTGWLGYWSSNSQSNITNEGPGRLYERNSGNSSEFWSSVGTTQRAIQNVDNIPFDSGDYSFSITVERVSPTELSVGWTIANSDGGSYSLSQSWTGVPGTIDLSFDRVGMGFGGGADVDLVAFSGVQVTSIPEPSTLALASVVVGSVLLLRRRKKA